MTGTAAATRLEAEAEQRSAWRQRLVAAVADRSFDDATLIAMLVAGFDQAHEEGISDAADICGQIGREVIGASRVALLLEKSLHRLIQLNRQTDKSDANRTRETRAAN